MRPPASLTFVIGLACLSLSALTTLEAQRRVEGDRRPPAAVDAAQAFIFAAYGDLMRQPLMMTFNTTGSTQIVSLEDARDPLRSGFARPAPLLVAEVELTVAQEVTSFRARGAYVSSNRSHAFREALEQHPEWSDEEARVWMAAAEVSTTPPQTGEAVARLARYLGGSVTTAAAVLTLRGGDATVEAAVEARQASVTRSLPVWSVDVLTTRPDRSSVLQRAQFDVVTGRLLTVVRR